MASNLMLAPSHNPQVHQSEGAWAASIKIKQARSHRVIAIKQYQYQLISTRFPTLRFRNLHRLGMAGSSSAPCHAPFAPALHTRPEVS